ncbi:MAG: MerC domain-containing protein [Bdellovibrionales bacterium]|nr:MerC domain-containing protein [Bdellovibrionales bacterium]
MKINNNSFDFSGITISLLCIFHCIFLPLILSFLPTIGLTWMVHNPVIHFGFYILMIAFALLAFIYKYRQHHSMAPIKWLVSGILLVGIGHFILLDHSQMNHSEINHSIMHNHHAQHEHQINNTSLMASSSQFNLQLSTIVAVIGSLLLIRGHFLNLKKASCCL